MVYEQNLAEDPLNLAPNYDDNGPGLADVGNDFTQAVSIDDQNNLSNQDGVAEE